ncbi:MAG: FG-GAP repeat protein, partial [Roseitalea porphyridii]|uniref:FG-GAP repeat protein n=1 Tax=Roseovarius sp. TaxID=1486281 RepID=UPI0032EBA048
MYVYLWNEATGLWEGTQTIVPPEAAFGDGFGTSMSVDGTRLIVGSIYADYVLPDAGGVYVY